MDLPAARDALRVDDIMVDHIAELSTSSEALAAHTHDAAQVLVDPKLTITRGAFGVSIQPGNSASALGQPLVVFPSPARTT